MVFWPGISPHPHIPAFFRVCFSSPRITPLPSKFFSSGYTKNKMSLLYLIEFSVMWCTQYTSIYFWILCDVSPQFNLFEDTTRWTRMRVGVCVRVPPPPPASSTSPHRCVCTRFTPPLLLPFPGGDWYKSPNIGGRNSSRPFVSLIQKEQPWTTDYARICKDSEEPDILVRVKTGPRWINMWSKDGHQLEQGRKISHADR